MKKETFEHIDFSLKALMEKQLNRVARELFEVAKKQAGHPEEMDDIEVRVEILMLKPIGVDKDAAPDK